MDYLEEAKDALIWGGAGGLIVEGQERLKIAASLATANALIALVERLDKLTINKTDKLGIKSHSLNTEISGSIEVPHPNEW